MLYQFVFLFLPNHKQKKFYTNPNFDFLAKDHKILAIIPFDVTINLRPKEKEKLKEGEMESLQNKEGEAVQSAIQTYFLKQKEKENFKVDFQDLSKTNALIAKAGWTIDSFRTKTKEEICSLLKVDGLISGF